MDKTPFNARALSDQWLPCHKKQKTFRLGFESNFQADIILHRKISCIEQVYTVADICRKHSCRGSGGGVVDTVSAYGARGRRFEFCNYQRFFC